MTIREALKLIFFPKYVGRRVGGLQLAFELLLLALLFVALLGWTSGCCMKPVNRPEDIFRCK